jgi:methyl-accepting chemotaxis protein
MRKRSILRQLRLRMLLFGVLMGLIFPVYANFFVMFNEGYFAFFVAGCIAAGITVGIVSYYFVKTILLKQLQIVAIASTELKNKNLNTVIHIESDDMVGDIIEGINNAIAEMKNLMAEIQAIFESSEKVLNNVHNGHSQAIESSMNIATAIETVSQVTQTISDLAAQTSVIVRQGQKAISSSQSEMNTVSKQIDALVKTMNDLVGHSSEIQNVLKVIGELTAQTNLLSLNATIEASKAGEMGRSFMVVAGEIRQLSVRSAGSSSAIRKKIEEINSAVEEAHFLVDTIHTQIIDNQSQENEVVKHFDNINQITAHFDESNGELKSSVGTLNFSFGKTQHTLEELTQNLNKLKGTIAAYQI